ncbi:MAG: heavy metal translocating P-type ATPase, partial [Bacteroidota bacterium]
MEKLHLRIKAIRHPREARRIERTLLGRSGITAVSAASPGMLEVEWDTEKIDRTAVINSVHQAGLRVVPQTEPKPQDTLSPEDHPPALYFVGENTELYFAVASGFFWLVALILSFLPGIPGHLTTLLYIVSAFLGGAFTFVTAGRDLLRGRFEIDFLMLFAAVGAGALGKWGEGALLLFLFSLGHALEHYAMKRARKSI